MSSRTDYHVYICNFHVTGLIIDYKGTSYTVLDFNAL